MLKQENYKMTFKDYQDAYRLYKKGFRYIRYESKTALIKAGVYAWINSETGEVGDWLYNYTLFIPGTTCELSSTLTQYLKEKNEGVRLLRLLETYEQQNNVIYALRWGFREKAINR